MPALRDTQATFGGGELTPALWGRTDLQKYKTGLKTGRNINIIPQGGARNRPGTGYIAKAGISASRVRLIPFIAATNQAYIIELGNFYARFYTMDAQVQVANVSAWVTGTIYAVGNYVTNGGNTYYCLIANTAGTFATDLAAGKWVAQTAYQIPTPYAAADIFNVKFAQSADVLYMAHPSYTPQQLTFNSGSSWSLQNFAFINGPFMVMNTSQSLTMTPSGTTYGAGTSWNISNVYIFNVGFGTPNILTFIVPSAGPTYGQQVLVAGMTGTFAFLNGQIFTSGGTSLSGGVYYLNLLNANLSPVTTTIAVGTYAGSGTVAIAVPPTLTSSQPYFQAGHVGALFQLQRTIVAQTISGTMANNSTNSTSIQCGSTWSIITLGTWTGKILIQVSIDNANWTTVDTLQAASTNYTTTGSTGYSQCYLRVVGDAVTTWAGTLTYDLTANSFDWNGVVQIVSITNANIAVINVIQSTQNAWPLADTNATYQWSEGSWSTLRGFPACVAFYQDRSTWASTKREPNTVWHSKDASYLDFGVSEPLVDSDGFSVVLSSRQLNNVVSLVPMPQALIALSGDAAFGLSPGGNGVYSATSVTQQLMDHRGSYAVDPVVVGNEIILLQQMGTVVRNLIFQLAVNGFMGDNISVSSQHLFTGYSIVQMAYQQEPDSIIWSVRSDGVLLSCTYDRAQEMSAWTHHDTLGGLYESVACIPNATLGVNEIWFVVNRGGTRYIEALKPRDQGSVPSAQWFMDCGTQYSGAPVTNVTGIPFPDGTVVCVFADGNVISNGITDASMTVLGGALNTSLTTAASVITVGIPFVWDVGLLDIEASNPQGGIQGRGSMQGQRVKMPRAKIRCWNSRGGYISTTPPAGPTGLTDTNGGSFDQLADIMQRDPSVNMDTALPLVTGIVDAALASGYQYGAAVCLRGVDPLPFTLLDVLPTVVLGGD